MTQTAASATIDIVRETVDLCQQCQDAIDRGVKDLIKPLPKCA